MNRQPIAPQPIEAIAWNRRSRSGV